MPKMTQPVNLNMILLGDPAAGKATQAAYLVKKYKLYDFDMGHEIAALRQRDPAINELLTRYQDLGKLTPTRIARQILRDTIASVPQRQGILFDGHPKMLGEAQLAARLLLRLRRADPLVIYLSIPLDETVKRMQGRAGYFRGKYGKRADDTVAGLKNRVKYYRTNIAQVIEFFSDRYEFYKISGLGTKEQVKREIDQTITDFLRRRSHGTKNDNYHDGEIH